MSPFELLKKGHKQICLLPASRLHSETPIQLSPDAIYFPPHNLDPETFRVVSYPAYEWKEVKRRADVVSSGKIQDSGNDLAWVKSHITQIEIEDFFGVGLVAVAVTMDWDGFLIPDTHEVHLEMMGAAIAKIEGIMDLVKLDYCRPDLSQTLPGRIGYLPDKRFTAALFYTVDDNESYIVAGELVTHEIVCGLGLALDGISPVQVPKDTVVGNIARHGLSMHSAALEAANDTEKFVQFMTLIDYLAAPMQYISMHDAKKRIGRHVAKSRQEYEDIMEDFKFLTSEGGKPRAQQKGLRHNIVHLGKRLEDMLNKEERSKVLRRIDCYASVVLQDFLRLSDESWERVEEYRKLRGIALGLDKS